MATSTIQEFSAVTSSWLWRLKDCVKKLSKSAINSRKTLHLPTKRSIWSILWYKETKLRTTRTNKMRTPKSATIEKSLLRTLSILTIFRSWSIRLWLPKHPKFSLQVWTKFKQRKNLTKTIVFRRQEVSRLSLCKTWRRPPKKRRRKWLPRCNKKKRWRTKTC